MCNGDQIRLNGIVIIKILFTYCHPQLLYWDLWTMKYYSIPHPTYHHVQMHYPVATMVKVSEDKTFFILD